MGDMVLRFILISEFQTIFKVVDGKSQVQVDTVPEKEESCVEEAVDGCPVGAISIA
jgi:ferredoxin